MKKLFALILSIASLPGFAQEKNFIDQPYIEVTGTAEMKVAPDEIYLRITLDEDDFKGKDSMEEKEKEFLEQLKRLDINISEDLTVRDMASNFDNLIFGTEINTRKTFVLKVREAAMAGSVMQALSKIDISKIDIDHVNHSELEDFRQQVKIMAIEAARKKAGDLAVAIGQSIGNAIYIQEISKTWPRPQSNPANVLMEVNYFNETPDVSFEKLNLEYSIMVRFILNQAQSD